MSFATRWAEGYQRAWEADDPDAAAALYAPDCVFRSAPFRDPEAMASGVHFGEPVEEGDRAAVEWWATLITPDGSEQALAGCSMLRFDDEGLVVESRDYWHLEPGRRDPPQGWGR
jgi:ketosteroid isomerase-like protein